MNMTMHIDDARLQLDLSGMQQRCSDTGPFLKAVGIYMEGSVGRNFAEERSPDGQPWAELKSRQGKILQDTGQHLKDPINSEVVGDAVRIGPHWDIAPVHQFGTNRAGRGRSTTIPARPFLGFRPEDPEAIEGMARDHIEGNLGIGRPML